LILIVGKKCWPLRYRSLGPINRIAICHAFTRGTKEFCVTLVENVKHFCSFNSKTIQSLNKLLRIYSSNGAYCIINWVPSTAFNGNQRFYCVASKPLNKNLTTRSILTTWYCRILQIKEVLHRSLVCNIVAWKKGDF
jgi:hypothetical protein